MPIFVGNSTVNTSVANSTVTVDQTQSWFYTTSNRNSIRPVLLLAFARSQTVDPRITFTRASSATYFNSLGVLSTAANNVPRVDYNPATGVCNGLLIEEGRTNSIPNNTMAGAVTGTPGTLPTTWTTYNNCGIVPSVVAIGTEQGISYIDVSFSGTPSATGATYVQFNTAGISATNAQIWTLSNYLKIVSGSLTNFGAINLAIQENTSGGAYVTSGALATSPTTGNLVSYRPTYTRTLNGGATTALISVFYQVNVTSGLAINLTLRIGMPQLELGAFATSVISTTSATASRAADDAVISGTNFSSVYNPYQGTVVFQGAMYATTTDATSRVLWGTSDATSNNAQYVSRVGSASTLNMQETVSSVTSSLTTSNSINANVVFLTSSYYSQPKTYGMVLNGSNLTSTSSGNVQTATQTQLVLGNAPYSGATNYINGWINRIAYYPTALSNSELITLTS